MCLLARQPLFFRETNPQPRKHTLWQATSDFTNNQATINRRHHILCPPGLLGKHFEKLIQCDPRLNSLSRLPDIVLESLYFEPRSVFEHQDESKSCGFDDVKDRYGLKISGFQDHGSLCGAPSTSTVNEVRVSVGRTPENVPQETLSPSSVMDTLEENPTTSRTKDVNDCKRWVQIKVPGLQSSMSVTDLVSHLGHCISGQTTPGNPLIPTDCSLNKDTLEELTQYLLNDSQVTSASDEQFLMSRVNSLCCLIQKDPPSTQSMLTDHNITGSFYDDDDDSDDELCPKGKPLLGVSAGDGKTNDGYGCKQTVPNMSGKESYGELLMHLPRIASMPEFLSNISEHSENQAR